MPDIFDQIAPSSSGGGDIFDQVAADQPTPAPAPGPFENNDILQDPLGMRQSAPIDAKSDSSLMGPPKAPAGPTILGFAPQARPAPRNAYEELNQHIRPAAIVPTTVPATFENTTPGYVPGMQTPQEAAGPQRINVKPLPASYVVTGASPLGTMLGNAQNDAYMSPESWDEMNDRIGPRGYAALPRQGIKQINRGTGDIAQGLYPNPNAEMTPSEAVDVGLPIPDYGKSSAPDYDRIAKGGVESMQGGMDLAAPFIASGVVQAPIKAAIQYGAGILAGNSAASVAHKMGATPNEEEAYRTAGFFFPSMMAAAVSLHGAINPEVGTEVDPITGKPNPVTLRGAVVGGRGFGAGVAKGENGEWQGAARVGPVRVSAKWGGNATAPIPDETAMTTTGGQGEPQAPPPLSAAQMTAHDNLNAATTALAKSQALDAAGQNIAAGIPPPAPPAPPAPGEAGSHQIPPPASTDNGAISPELVQTIAKLIQSAPEEMQPQLVMQAHDQMAKLILSKGKIIAPDGTLHT